MRRGRNQTEGKGACCLHVPHVTCHASILLNNTVSGRCRGKSWTYGEYVRALLRLIPVDQQAIWEGVALPNSFFWYPGELSSLFR